jgi:RNA polymerase sigma-70 factor (ECF subfamily)
MSSAPGPEPDSNTPPRGFPPTLWTVVLAAKENSSAEADAALEQLCRTYWWPLYAFVRRRGYGAHDAEDLTQAFFEGLLAKDFLRAVDRTKGKFRSYLLARLENFLKNEWRNARTQKRGGKIKFVSINDETAEQPYLQVAASNLSAEEFFEKQWATTLLAQAAARLRDEFIASGKGAFFEEIKVFLTREKHAASYAELATRLGTTEDALKTAVMRMKKRYGELLRAEIANTVSSPEEVDEELRALMRALSL